MTKCDQHTKDYQTQQLRAAPEAVFTDRYGILISKVYSECAQSECPTNVLTIPAYSAPAASVVDCSVENIVVTSTSIKTNVVNPSLSKVTVTLTYTLVVDYADVNGNIFTISEEFSLTKTVALYAFEGMDVIVLAMGQCLNTSISPDGTQIAVEVGLFIVIKIAKAIQTDSPYIVCRRFGPGVKGVGRCPWWCCKISRKPQKRAWPPQPNGPVEEPINGFGDQSSPPGL